MFSLSICVTYILIFDIYLQIDFDKTKHLTDKAIRKRRLEREKLEQLEKDREEKVLKERDDLERKLVEEK